MAKDPDVFDRKQLNLMLPIIGLKQAPVENRQGSVDAESRQRLLQDLENIGLRKPAS